MNETWCYLLKKGMSGRFLWVVGSIAMALAFTLVTCLAVWDQREKLPLEVLMLLLGQLLGVVNAVVGYYYLKERKTD